MTDFNFRNEKLRQVIEFVELHPGQYSTQELADQFNLSYDQIAAGLRRAKRIYKLSIKKDQVGVKSKKQPTIKREEYIPPPPNTENVLVIGDIHEPFALEGYKEFCYEQYKKYKCTHVIFIGDVLDNHGSSYHEQDPDGMSAGDETDEAFEKIAEWSALFPRADVILGNHDRLVMRKAFTGNIPRRWIMSFQDVLGVPGWDFKERAVYDGIQYIHGEGGTARVRCKKDLMSTVQGHLHPQAYTEWFVGSNYRIFGMQVGCGVDKRAYALAYAKDHPKPAIGAGVILNHGEQAFNVLMKL